MKAVILGLILASSMVAGTARAAGVCDDNTCVLVPIQRGPYVVVACVAPYSPYYPANPAAYPVCH